MGRLLDQTPPDHRLSTPRPAPVTEGHALVFEVAHSPVVELIETLHHGEASGISTVLVVASSGKGAMVRMMERLPWILTATISTTKHSTECGTNEDTTEVSDPGKMLLKGHRRRQALPPSLALLSSHPRPLHQVPSPRYHKSLTPPLQRRKFSQKTARMSPRQAHPHSHCSIESLPRVPKWHQGCAKL